MTAANFILVADDDEPSREGLKLLLSRWGYAAETAVEGQTRSITPSPGIPP